MKFNEYVKQYRLKYFKNLEKFAKIIKTSFKTNGNAVFQAINSRL